MTRKKKSINVEVKGQTWTFQIISERLYDTRHPELKGTPANCAFPDRKCDIRADHPVTFENMLHELLHCFVFETNTESTKHDADDREEICCSILGENYFILGALAEKIVRGLAK